jgi:fucose permease
MPFLLGLLSEQYTNYHILGVIGLILILPILYFAFTKFPKPKQTQSVPLKNIRSLLKDVNLLFLGLILFFQSGVEGIINNWSTLYLQTESSFIQDHALYALSLFVLSLTLTRVALIFLLNRIRPYRILITSVFLITLGVFCFMAPGLIHREVIGLVLLGSGLAAGFPIVLSYVGTLYPQFSGIAFSIVLVIALSGNILLNFFMGLISKIHGVGVFSTLLLTCTISLAAVLVITLKRISRKIKI